jgi:hypothetical protein
MITNDGMREAKEIMPWRISNSKVQDNGSYMLINNK